MGRVLSQQESAEFLLRHLNIQREIDNINRGGSSPDLVYPRSGRAVLDRNTYVLVWRDARARWWFIDLTGHPGVPTEVNKPQYFSPDSGFLSNVIQRTAAMLEAGARAAMALIGALPWLVGGLLLIMVLPHVLPARK